MDTTTILLLLFFVNLNITEAVYKRWQQNANFGNPYNWNSGRKPCGNDRLLIHEESPAVFLQVNTTIQELILPANGEIAFGLNTVLAFTNEPDHSAECLSSGSQIEYNVTYARDWLDPKNWCSADSAMGTCKSVSLLDSEKVPCATDDVIFPKDGSYFVNLDSGIELAINSMKITTTAYTSDTFGSFLNTSEGLMMFPEPRTGKRSMVNILRRRCTDPTGCKCENDKIGILSKVCKFQMPHCPRIKCTEPIRPAGSCCEICGAVLKVVYGTGFKFSDMRDGLKRSFLEGKTDYNDVTYIVSKLIDDTIQIVLSDITGSPSIKAAKAMKADLDNDSAGGFKYAVRSVSMDTSEGAGGVPSTGARKMDTSMPGGEIAGIVVGLIVVLVIGIGVAIFVYRRKTGDEMGFKVFDRISFKPNFRKPRLEVPPSFPFRFGSGGSSTVENIGSRSQGFDNPMYGDNPLENEKPLDIEMMPSNISGSMEMPNPDEYENQPTFDNSLGFDNPLYDSVNQESMFSDAASVETKEDKK